MRKTGDLGLVSIGDDKLEFGNWRRDLLWSHGECENKEETDSPLDGKDVAEGLLCDVGDEGADDAERYTLHEDCEEHEGGLNWCSEFERCYLEAVSVQRCI
jgi:hypothetical protein